MIFGSFITGLRIWDSGADLYSHSDLETSWLAVDNHDHTVGKGKQIPAGGLAPGSVDGNTLALNSVTSAHIVDGTIQRVDLANGIIGINQIDPSIFEGITPLGAITPWFRPATTVAVPPGWVIADGRTLNSDQHGWTGITNITVPDLRGQFVIGAATTTPASPAGVSPVTIGPAVNQVPAENSKGGTHARFFDHSHTVAGHSHTVNGHTHDLPWHSHTISPDGAHNHSIHSRTNAFDGYYVFKDVDTNTHATNKQSLYIAGFNGGPSDPWDAALPTSYPPNDGAHSHGARTGDSSGTTTSASPGTSSTALTTDSENPGGDIRPAWTGLLYIVKVKHGA